MSTGGWVRSRCRWSPSNWFQHPEAHLAGVHLSDDHPHAFQQQRKVHLWGDIPSFSFFFTHLYKLKNTNRLRLYCWCWTLPKDWLPMCPSVRPLVSQPCRRSNRRRIFRRGSWSGRCSRWPVGSPPRECSPRSRSRRRLRTATCLQSMTSLPPNCTGSKSKQVWRSFK